MATRSDPEKWVILRRPLCFRACEYGLNGLSVARSIREGLQILEFDLSRIKVALTDGASVNDTTCDSLGISKDKHVNCYAHALALCIWDAVDLHDEVDLAISNMKDFIGLYHQSILLRESIDSICHQEGLQVRALPQPVKTRWFSLCIALGHVLVLEPAVKKIRDKRELLKRISVADGESSTRRLRFPSDDDFVVLRLIYPGLIAVTRCIALLEGSKLPTLSMVPCVMAKLRKDLFADGTKCRFNDTLWEQISRRCASKYPDVVLLAHALDPRFKNLRYLRDDHHGEVARAKNLC